MTWEAAADIASIATPIGVLLAFWQLVLAKRQAVAAFEDSLSAQYRALLAQIPVKALLGQSLFESEAADSLGTFYRYFDLSNEQAFLRSRRRIGEGTWTDWREGIQQNMKLPAFASAWVTIRSAKTGAFDDLARVIDVPTTGPSRLPQQIKGASSE